MNTVRHIMEKNVITIDYNKTAFDTAKLLVENNTDFAIILQDKKPIGIVTESDYIKKIIIKNKNASEIPIKDIMTENFQTVKPSTEIENAIQKMLNNSIKRLLVFENNDLVGVVTQIGLASYLRNKLLIDSTIRKIESDNND
ncbi:MAG: CBS domain-containing protein [Nitrosopumilaceae archaeon]|nr:CBS domain-containing protein [Nitrosopumilaceae archaeon]